MYCLVLTGSYLHAGGGGRRTYEVLKHLSEFDITPILYIPFSDLSFSMLLAEIYKLEKIDAVLKKLESFNVIIPEEIYNVIDAISSNLQHSLDSFQKKTPQKFLLSFVKHFETIKANILLAKRFLERYIQDEKAIQNKLVFVYSMNEIPSCVITGTFLAAALKKKLYILLQLEPFKPLKDFVVEDWRLKVTLAKRPISRELLRLLLLISRFMLTNTRYAYSYAYRNNVLDGLLAVSEAPLIISKLNSWAYRRRIGVKIVKPGNSVDEAVSKYANEQERQHLLNKKEDIAIYYGRLHSPKGLFEVIPIAKMLASKGYHLVMAGRFDNIVEKELFFKKCKEKGIKNIEYLGWLPREELLNIVSKSKLLIYPSHSDAFPLVVLEALFLGCSVVAYDIPAIRSVYKGLRPVKIVKEYDCKAMANEAIKILKRDISRHEEEHLDRNLIKFLQLHSSWKNVAEADINAIREIMNTTRNRYKR